MGFILTFIVETTFTDFSFLGRVEMDQSLLGRDQEIATRVSTMPTDVRSYPASAHSGAKLTFFFFHSSSGIISPL